MIDLNDPRVAQAIVAAVDRRVDQKLARLAQERYGVVTAVDTTNLKATVAVSGDPNPAPGVAFAPETMPLVGDLVRVVLTPDGDRYIEAVAKPTDSTQGVGSFGAVTVRRPDASGRYVFRSRAIGDAVDRIAFAMNTADDTLELGNGSAAPGTMKRIHADGRFEFSGAVNAPGLSITGGITTAMLATAARRLRYVEMAPNFDLNGATATADVASTLIELTSVPANAAALIAVVGMVRTSDTSNANMSLRHYSDTEATIGYSSGTAGRGGTFFGLCVPGGTNGRQIRYAADWISGTITLWIRPVGYFTTADA